MSTNLHYMKFFDHVDHRFLLLCATRHVMYGQDINHHFFRKAIAEHWIDIPKPEQELIRRDVEYNIFDSIREHTIDQSVIDDWEAVRKNWKN